MDVGVPAYPPPSYATDATLSAVGHSPHGPAPPTEGVVVKQQLQSSRKPPILRDDSVYEAANVMKIASVTLRVLCCLCGSPLTLICFIPAIILSKWVLGLVLPTMPFLCFIITTTLYSVYSKYFLLSQFKNALKLYNMIVCLRKLQASNYHEFGDSNKACHSTVCSEVLVFVWCSG